MAVDTHIFRVGNRTGLATGKNVLIVENKLVERIPDDFIVDAHHYLIYMGVIPVKHAHPNAVLALSMKSACSKTKPHF
jgi:endonuclease III